MDFLHKLVCAVIALLVLCKSARSQNECTYTLNITTGQHYQITNPSFPNFYTPGSDCTWEVTTSQAHRVKLTCDNIYMPSLDSSCKDYLAVTTTGDLRDASAFCVPFTVAGSSVKIQLISSRRSWGGIFSCDITTEEIPPAGPTENCECGWSQSDWKAQMEKIGGHVLTYSSIPFLCTTYIKEHLWATVCANKSRYMNLKLGEGSIKSAPTNLELFNKICIIAKLFPNKSRIVGGTDAEINEFPSMVKVMKYINETHTYVCGGTIIGRRVVLTAAHCVDPEPRYIGLIIGEHVITKSDEANHAKHLKISRVIIHPNASISKRFNDIALLVTAADIEYTSSVGPACLPFNIKKKDLIGKHVTVTGWGILKENGSSPERLQKVDLQIVPDANCTPFYNKKYKFIPQYNLCTFETEKGTCYGDSGGPLYYYNHQKSCHIVVGIVNRLKGCGGPYPSVQIDVHYNLPWILDQLPDVEFCKK